MAHCSLTFSDDRKEVKGCHFIAKAHRAVNVDVLALTREFIAFSSARVSSSSRLLRVVSQLWGHGRCLESHGTDSSLRLQPRQGVTGSRCF